MKIKKKNYGTIIGGIFTVSSLLLTFTAYVPLLSIIIVSEIKELMGIKTTFIFFILLMLLSLIIIIRISVNYELKKSHIVIIMAIYFFIIHPLGYVLYCGIGLNFRNDGQTALAIFLTYPISSFGFLILGILIDLVKGKASDNT